MNAIPHAHLPKSEAMVEFADGHHHHLPPYAGPSDWREPTFSSFDSSGAQHAHYGGRFEYEVRGEPMRGWHITPRAGEKAGQKKPCSHRGHEPHGSCCSAHDSEQTRESR